jgi:hypothetical protein
MAPHPTSKRRPPERDYSHRSLLDKLGVRSELHIAVLSIHDEGFLQQLATQGLQVSSATAKPGTDLIFLSAESKQDLSRLETFIPLIQKNGAIWVVYPKGQSHIREIDVIAAGKAAGLVDNKVVRFSETHTALRLVIPRAKR